MKKIVLAITAILISLPGFTQNPFDIAATADLMKEYKSGNYEIWVGDPVERRKYDGEMIISYIPTDREKYPHSLIDGHIEIKNTDPQKDGMIFRKKFFINNIDDDIEWDESNSECTIEVWYKGMGKGICKIQMIPCKWISVNFLYEDGTRERWILMKPYYIFSN